MCTNVFIMYTNVKCAWELVAVLICALYIERFCQIQHVDDD